METITSSQLAPTATLNLPTASTPDFSSYLTVSPTQNQAIETTKTNKEQSYQDLVNEQVGLSTRGARTLQYEDQAGIPILNKDLTEIENQLTKTDLDFRRERERIQAEPGLTMAQRNARLGDVSRKQASTLADMEVIRSARSNTLQNAQSFVQRKTAIEFADEQARIDNLKFIYENNSGELKDQLEQVYKREERAFQVEKDKYQTTEAEKINLVRNAQSNGASNSVMSDILNSKTLEEAYRSARSYGMSIDDKIKQAQLNKLISEINEAKDSTPEASEMDKDSDFAKLKGNAELKNKLTAYKTLVDQYGAKRKDKASAAVLDSAYQEVLQAYRAAKDLKALVGADFQLIDDAIKTATFEKTGFGKVLNVPLLGIPTELERGKTTRRAKTSIDEAFNAIERGNKELQSIIESKNPSWVSTPYYQTITGGSSNQDYELNSDDSGNIIIPVEVSNEDFFSN